MINPQQKLQFEEQGYLILKQLFSPEQTQAICRPGDGSSHLRPIGSR